MTKIYDKKIKKKSLSQILNTFPTSQKKNFILKASLILVLVMMVFYPLVRYYWQEYRWRWIIVHHTGSDSGDLAFIKKEHKQKGWHDAAYHFIINNGSRGTISGQIEESDRWKNRENAGSTRRNHVNTYGIAIVMIGNLHKHSPSSQQKEALVNLLERLSSNYNIPIDKIRGHREFQNTKCPGKFLDMKKIRQTLKNKSKNP